ncbi:DUF1427 family protein [Neisseria shayeganii]|uniref:DUF1427 family protein n=1 Tax=Neisseria shayeganii TaxID=607712 RepID=A0A7D7N4N3_9NEIS|nr:DUF1427 family protein [Neisseria shayeganii]QMT41405.1 DUF1427 family protein [Neisseria shayeganii]
MKMYVFSFGAGILVGVVYYLLNVRSPAPPVVALLGLLGMLLGEQMIPFSKQFFSPPASISQTVHTQDHNQNKE